MLRNNTQFKIGLLIISTILVLGIFAPLFSTFSPGTMDITQRLLPPSSNHWLGTDMQGIDVWTSLLYGARLSLSISFFTVSISTLMGTFLGLAAGYYGKWIDVILMRTIDILMAFPGILLPLVLSSLIPHSYFSIVLSLLTTGWIGPTKIVRAELLSIKEREFVLAAYSAGAKTSRILFRHLLPHLFPILITQMTFSISSVIIIESSLSFLGLGPRWISPTWGQLLNEGRALMGQTPILTVAPGLGIFLVVLSANFIGNALKQHFDPTHN